MNRSKGSSSSLTLIHKIIFIIFTIWLIVLILWQAHGEKSFIKETELKNMLKSNLRTEVINVKWNNLMLTISPSPSPSLPTLQPSPSPTLQPSPSPTTLQPSPVPTVQQPITTTISESIKRISQPHQSYNPMHIIFSTDCSSYQDWQSILLFYSAIAVANYSSDNRIGQGPGPITRIASGCTEEQKLNLTTVYKKLFSDDLQFKVHFTPDFSKVIFPKVRYPYYNKPRGLKHWLDNNNDLPSNLIISLIDPDMIFLRPMTSLVRSQSNNLYDKRLLLRDLGYEKSEIFHMLESKTNNIDNFLQEQVEKGKPVGQLYGLGAPWTREIHAKFNKTIICGADSPCLKVSERSGQDHYAVGPPYMLHISDAKRIAKTWSDFTPRVYLNGYPHLLAEMYAYSMAAAAEELPHLSVFQHMVSSTSAGGEGWPHIDKLEEVCVPSVNGYFYPGKPLPTVQHYCQHYEADGYAFGKHSIHHNIFSCDNFKSFPLPSRDIKHNFNDPIDVSADRPIQNKQKQLKYSAFSLCVIHEMFNSAITWYKNKMC